MDTAAPIELSPEIKLAQLYAQMVHHQLGELLACDRGCVQVTLRPDRTIERRYTFEVVIGPWEGAAACHRYEGHALIGMSRAEARRAPDPMIGAIVRKDTDRLADRLATTIAGEHQFKRRRPVCRQPDAERGLDQPAEAT